MWRKPYNNAYLHIKAVQETGRPDLNEKRRKLASLEEELNRLSNGLFFGEFAHRGLETYTISEIKRLTKQVGNPVFKEKLREAVEEHISFYSEYYGKLTPQIAKSTSVNNILKMAKWLNIEVALHEKEEEEATSSIRKTTTTKKQKNLLDFF